MNDLDEALSALNAIDPGCEREVWVRVGMAAKAAGISFEDFDRWSSHGENYKGPRDVQTFWRNTDAQGGVGRETLFHFALESGWKPPARDADERRAGKAAKTSKNAKGKRNLSVTRSPEEVAARSAAQQAEAAKQQADLARGREWLKQLLLAASQAPETHPYIVRKRISPDGLLALPFTRAKKILGFVPETSRGELVGDTLLISPLHNGDGTALSAELIDESGRKWAIAGLPKGGLMWGPTLAKAPPSIGVAEGVATAKSAAVAGSMPVFAVGGYGNFAAALENLRTLFPESEYVLFADLGKSLARTQTLAHQLFFPCIAPDPAQMKEGDTDFNDFECNAGQDAVWEWVQPRLRGDNQILWSDAITPVHIEFVLPGLPLGAVGMIVGPGSVGKTFLAMDLGASVALGESISGMTDGYATPTQGRTALVLGEDPSNIIHNRLSDIIAQHQLGREKLTLLDQRMKIVSMVGEDMRLVEMERNQPQDGAFLQRLEALCRGRRLVILDPLIRLHDGDENDNNVANKLLLAIQRVALKTNCTILLLHHVGKGDKSGWQAARGASAYTTSVRWQMNVQPPNDEQIADLNLDGGERDPDLFIHCSGVKTNYGPKQRDGFWMRRARGGALVAVDIAAFTNGGLPAGFPSAPSDLPKPSGGQLPRGLRKPSPADDAD
jgi:hypothetical protein